MRKVNYIKLLLISVFIIGSLTACGGDNSDGEITYDAALVTDSSVFNCPTEDNVINALQAVASIDEIMAVTENHDPNDGLNKAGGYTASVYFSIPSVNDASSNDDIVDRGVDSGGCIEVYTTKDDANKRADKLKSLQKLHAGGYVVLETTVIRLSYKMNESQWSNLTNGIITSFMNPPEKIELSVEDETSEFNIEEDIADISESEIDETESDVEDSEQEHNERKLFTTSKVNIREMPNTDCEVLGKVEAGQEVIEYEAGSDGWSKVVCGGVEGYIKSEYLTQDAPSTSTAQSETSTPGVDSEKDTESVKTVATNTVDTQESVGIAQDTSIGSVGNGDNFNTYDNVEQQKTSDSWVLNTSRMKIHYPSCKSVPKISPENYTTSNSSVAELQAQGYSTCGNCFK